MEYLIHFNKDFSNFDKSRKYNMEYLYFMERYFNDAFWSKYLGLGIPLNDILFSLGGKPEKFGWKYGIKNKDDVVFIYNKKGTNPSINITVYLEELY